MNIKVLVILLIIIILIAYLYVQHTEKLTENDLEQPPYISHDIQNTGPQKSSYDNPNLFFHYYPHLIPGNDITQSEEQPYIPHEVQNTGPQKSSYDNPSLFFHYYPHLST